MNKWIEPLKSSYPAILTKKYKIGDKEKPIIRTYDNFNLGPHPGLTRMRLRSIRFLLFEIKPILVYNSATFILADSFIYTIYSKRICRHKKYKEKA